MRNLNAADRNVLTTYPKALAHLRKQRELKRLGLVFGSGLSKLLGVPTWPALVELIASDSEVDGTHVLERVAPREGLPYKTELLFEHYRKRRYASADPTTHYTRVLDYEIFASWLAIVRRHLYGNVVEDFSKALEEHPYFRAYLPLIEESHMTVTYNFDDFIERALAAQRTKDEEKESRGYETVTNPWMQFRRTTAIIYHPNGVVPRLAMESQSDRFVFSEASYSEQILGILSGDNAGLLNHLSKHTCLLIGLSLEDETVRSLLAHSAHCNPGNFHYYVSYVGSGEVPSDDHREAIRTTNFKVYNLITLFLGDAELASLAELIRVEEAEFCDCADEVDVPSTFRFYLTGPLGVGKSTSINHFRNLHVSDEWVEPRLPILAERWDSLSDSQKEEADAWILRQFELKNDTLRRKKVGLFIVDRGPLDPIAFTPEDQRPDKARRLLKAMCGGTKSRKKAGGSTSSGRRVAAGHVILLVGNRDELAIRMLLTQRNYDAESLARMETDLAWAYQSPGVTVVDTKGLSVGDVVRKIARIVHLDEYVECNLQGRLDEIAGKKP